MITDAQTDALVHAISEATGDAPEVVRECVVDFGWTTPEQADTDLLFVKALDLGYAEPRDHS